MNKYISGMLLISSLVGCAHQAEQNKNIEILPVEKVDWQKLNPARGDKSPQAGTLWGDRKGTPATGFLAKFVDGFSSPPHVHNVSYRAIVIEGLVHNDDPKAANMWMPKESYWTQPAGESHITSAKGDVNIALVEINHGPYLVKPIAKKFDNGERPYNIHASNIIWKNQGNYKSVDLWKDQKGTVTGSMIKFSKSLNVESVDSKFVVVSGAIEVNQQVLNPGSLVSITGKNNLKLNCQRECTVYIKTNQGYKAQ